MTYSLDLRERAVRCVSDGVSQTEVARIFGIHPKTLFNWLRLEDLRPKKHGPRRRKLDKAALAAHVRDYPDAYLHERAAHFGVSHQAIWTALRAMKIGKKNDQIRRGKSQ